LLGIEAFAAFALLVAGGVLGVRVYRHLRQAPLSAQNQVLLVTLVRPGSLTSWPVNTYVPVMATIQSTAPVASLELWARGGETSS
jgi:hypothetical protein